MLVLLVLTVIAPIPTFPPQGGALAEVICEECTEHKNARLTAKFVISRSSHPGFIGKSFEIEYEDVARVRISDNGSVPLLLHFAVNDRAYFWVNASGKDVKPVWEDNIFDYTPSRSYFMVPIRERCVRRADDLIVLLSKENDAFGKAVMEVASETDRKKQRVLLDMYADSKFEPLAKWALWARRKYHSVQIAGDVLPDASIKSLNK